MIATTPLDVFYPAFREPCVSVFCSTSDEYTPYCCVMLQSLIDHATPEKNYDIIVLHSGLSKSRQQDISSITRGARYLSIRFYDVTAFMQGKMFFRGSENFSLATWYRLFAPTIFSEYDKIVYLDVDTVVLTDIAELYHQNIGEYWIAACTDLAMLGDSLRGKNTHDYILNTIGLIDAKYYVNGGVMLMNLGKMREQGVEQACVEAALHHEYRCYDQDAFNHVCRGHIYYLDLVWNIFPARGFEEDLNESQLIEYKEKRMRRVLSTIR